MRLPRRPPPLDRLLKDILTQDPAVFLRLTATSRGALVGARYRHWHRLQYLKPPTGMTHEEWWLTLKLSRRAMSRSLPLVDTAGVPFSLALVDPALEMLHEVDTTAGKSVTVPGDVAHKDNQERHLVTSLMEEAITSSQLEGAATTRDVAKAMLRSGRAPRTHAERMIHNNYATIRWLRERTSDPLTADLIREIHGRMTQGTLDDQIDEGRFRKSDDIRVRYQGEDVYKPPAAADLDRRVGLLCDFANGERSHGFVHPVVRAIVLHFWLAYEHPFVDGNGRTARTLFYWSMLRSGHWICEFLPISRIFLQAPARYARAFLYTESDDNDLTYFVLYHLDVLRHAMLDLHEFLRVRSSEQQAARRGLSASSGMNHRQIALLTHALKHNFEEYTFTAHKNSHGVAYQTARTDLMDLERRGLLTKTRVGKTFVYTAAGNLSARLEAGKTSRAPKSRRR